MLEEIGISEISNGSQLFTVTKYIQLFAFSCARFYYDTKLCGSFTCRDQIRLWHFDVLRVQKTLGGCFRFTTTLLGGRDAELLRSFDGISCVYRVLYVIVRCLRLLLEYLDDFLVVW